MTAQPLARAKVVYQARRWIGTPWRHQHRMIGVGVDCASLIIAAGVGAGAMDEPGDRFAPWRGYARTPNPRRMRAALETFLVEIPQGGSVEDGDVAWIAWREAPDLPMHLALRAMAGGRKTLIHSTERVGRVVEHGFTGEWPALVHSWWRYPGLG